jgi:hypothetical protein
LIDFGHLPSDPDRTSDPLADIWMRAFPSRGDGVDVAPVGVKLSNHLVAATLARR